MTDFEIGRAQRDVGERDAVCDSERGNRLQQHPSISHDQQQSEHEEQVIRTEYDVPVRFEKSELFTARWVTSADATALKKFLDSNRVSVADDHEVGTLAGSYSVIVDAGRLGRVDRRLEGGHQVDQVAGLLGLLDLDGLLALDLGVDDRLQRRRRGVNGREQRVDLAGGQRSGGPPGGTGRPESGLRSTRATISSKR